MLATWLDTSSINDGRMLVAYEDDIADLILDLFTSNDEFSKLYLYDMKTNLLLNHWLKDNSGIIPIALGGTAPPCKCVHKPGTSYFRDGHKDGCPYSGSNYRTCEWFRKIIALHYALDLYSETQTFDIIVFVDADVIFQKRLTPETVTSVFEDKYGVFYHLGPIRRKIGHGVESGFIGFNKTNGGFKFIKRVIKVYSDGTFLLYPKWNDSYVFRMVLEASMDIPSIDVVKRAPEGSGGGQVINLGPFAEYIHHDKGKNGYGRISFTHEKI